MRAFHKLFSIGYKKLAKQKYVAIPHGLLFTNWWYQKIYRINQDVPFLVHYTSLINGANNIIFNKENETIKNCFAVSGGCYFGISEGSTLTIGDDTIWAWNVNIQTANHDFLDRSIYHTKNIVIGKNCWIGGGVTILPGVELGDNVTVGANSVVTKSFHSNVVIAGVPARIIREL